MQCIAILTQSTRGAPKITIDAQIVFCKKKTEWQYFRTNTQKYFPFRKESPPCDFKQVLSRHSDDMGAQCVKIFLSVNNVFYEHLPFPYNTGLGIQTICTNITTGCLKKN